MGVPDEDAIAGLAEFEPSPMRMSLVMVGHMTIINDAYNCNPGSLAAALEVLVEAAGQQVSAAALGDMLELGSGQRARAPDVGCTGGRTRSRTDCILFGTEVEALRAGARSRPACPLGRVSVFESKTALVDTLRKELERACGSIGEGVARNAYGGSG